jgi:hypothetical protein
MAPQQPLVIIDPLLWERSSATRLALGHLVTAGKLAANEDGRPAEWIVPPGRDHEPNAPSGYVVSFIRFHEQGFMAPASRFMRALCFHYSVELHNFAPNVILQAATFVGVGGCSRRWSRGPATWCASAACRSPCGSSTRTTISSAR